MKKGITVLICTYNGASRLPETLNHLASQLVSENLDWEIILVDNASTDNTSAIAVTEWKQHNIHHVPLTVIHESKPGKLFAFQKGIAQAKYEYFIVCDDDNWLSDDYLSIAFDILENNSKIGATGGQTKAVTETGLSFPSWFETHKEGYAVGEQAPATCNITSRGHLWGAGLSSRTALYKEVYKKIPSLLINNHNRKILSAEDTEYCLRIIIRGYQLHYDTRLSLKHFIPAGRLNLKYKDDLYENFKNAHFILEKYYLAIKFGPKNKLGLFNKIRLTIITPLRLAFASSKSERQKQETIMSYLLPTFARMDPISTQIKKYILQ